jgi:UDP-N-acetylmuramyl pentapeptide phosphotransferase/UDP-N-acetylglucosamine-1-phosphate transferase
VSDLPVNLWLQSGAIAAAAMVTSYVVTTALQPLLHSYALVKPNTRSTHKQPTPQGGGIAVIAGTMMIAALAGLVLPDFAGFSRQLAVLLAMTGALAIIGVTDDIRPLEAMPRLLLQAVAVVVLVAALPAELRILSALPWLVERALLVLGIIWFINLVNFMDGIDWMTVSEVVPVSAALALFGLMGALPTEATLVAMALCGATIGFAPFNRPVARLFLGDVGSLPIGLLLAWLLVLLAGRGHLVAALTLPLYYTADATLTLLLRLFKGQPLMQAHRSHFYQRAIDGGVGVYRIVGGVFAANLALAGLAAATLLSASRVLHIISFAAASALVGALLWYFSRARHALGRHDSL